MHQGRQRQAGGHSVASARRQHARTPRCGSMLSVWPRLSLALFAACSDLPSRLASSAWRGPCSQPLLLLHETHMSLWVTLTIAALCLGCSTVRALGTKCRPPPPAHAFPACARLRHLRLPSAESDHIPWAFICLQAAQAPAGAAANVMVPSGVSWKDWMFGRYNAPCSTFDATTQTWAVDASLPPGTRAWWGRLGQPQGKCPGRRHAAEASS